MSELEEVVVSANPFEESSNGKFLDDFFQQEDILKSAIGRLDNAAIQVNNLKTANITATDANDEKRISETLGRILEDTNKEIRNIKNALKRLNEQTDQLEKENVLSNTKLNIRRNSHSTLTRQFLDALRSYQKSQEDYELEIKAKVTRQIRIVDPNASDAMINDIFESGDPSSVIKQAIVGPVNAQIEETYREVQEKYRDVVKLVKSVHELHQLFEDMAILVSEQGQLLDKIDANTKMANNNIKKANTNLDKALEHQKEARKYRCCLIICVIVLIVVICLVFGLISF